MQQADIDPFVETDGKYTKISNLGAGSFGCVVLAQNRAGKNTAVKLLKRGAINKYVEAEILNHSKLRHPHVIQFKEVFLTTEHICIAMEYATGGSLFHYVQKQGMLNETASRWFFQQLILGLDYCHKRGVANRDIKLENTLLQAVNGLPLPLVKICDFGYSKADAQSVAKSKVGTLTYMAPEVIVNRNGKYDGKVADIWSCGVMLYVMLYGRYPFDSARGADTGKGRGMVQLLDKMVGMGYNIPEDVPVSADCLDILKRMLLPDPTARITIEQIMVHPWFTTSLPAQAATMNANYLKAPFPSDYMTEEDIAVVIADAKKSSSGSSQGGASQAEETVAKAEAEALSLIQEEEEAMAAEASTAGSDTVKRFFNTHGSFNRGR